MRKTGKKGTREKERTEKKRSGRKIEILGEAGTGQSARADSRQLGEHP